MRESARSFAQEEEGERHRQQEREQQERPHARQVRDRAASIREQIAQHLFL